MTQVCREYQRGNCTRGENDCRFAHPADSTMIDTNDNTVTVCMDYIKGRCSREKCKYFHPPAHLQAKIKAAQHQVNQAAAAAAMVRVCPIIAPPKKKKKHTKLGFKNIKPNKHWIFDRCLKSTSRKAFFLLTEGVETALLALTHYDAVLQIEKKVLMKQQAAAMVLYATETSAHLLLTLVLLLC